MSNHARRQAISKIQNSSKRKLSYAIGKKVITFTDKSKDKDGTIVSWIWDFGDWGTSTEQNPTHRYVKFGVYAVTLTVTDNEGARHSISKNVTVTN